MVDDLSSGSAQCSAAVLPQIHLPALLLHKPSFSLSVSSSAPGYWVLWHFRNVTCLDPGRAVQGSCLDLSWGRQEKWRSQGTRHTGPRANTPASCLSEVSNWLPLDPLLGDLSEFLLQHPSFHPPAPPPQADSLAAGWRPCWQRRG